VRTPIDADTDLWDEYEPMLEDVTQYKRLVRLDPILPMLAW